MLAIWRDILYAFRLLRRNRGFAAIAILTLALGIGATTAIFSVFNGVLLHPLAFSDPGRLIAIQEIVPQLSQLAPVLPVAPWHYREWRKQNRSVEQIALVGRLTVNLTSNGEPERVWISRVSASLFPMLGVHMQLGRSFLEQEDQAGSDNVVILSDRIWKRRFQRDPRIVGRAIDLDGAPHEVVGILPADAPMPKLSQLVNMWRADDYAEMWKPFAMRPLDLFPMSEFNFGCIARLKPGISINQAVADLNVIQDGIAKTLPKKTDLRVTAALLQEQITGRTRQSLTLLLAAAGGVLLIVCVNIANLLLARGVARRKELAIRSAIGASGSRIAWQLLTESALLAAIGGALGVIVAQWSLKEIVLHAPVDLPRLHELRMDSDALGFSVLVTIASGILFGVLPACRLARTDPQSALKSGSQTVSGGRNSGNALRCLIGVEVALSAMCLIMAGLLLNSFVRLMRVDKGFQPERAITVDLGLTSVRYPDAARRVQFLRTILDRVHSLPGVVAAGVSNRLPLAGEGQSFPVFVEGAEASAGELPVVDYRCVNPEFFRALGIPLLSGRIFDEADRGRLVALMSAQTDRRLWAKASQAGKRLRLGGERAPLIEVIGVVGDVHGAALQKAPSLTLYLPYWQRHRPDMSLVVRTSIDPLRIASAVRGEIRRLDSEMPIPQFRTMDQVVDESLAQRRFQLDLVLLFAVAALLLTTVGVYGVVSQSVTQRTNEIGVRIALGASSFDVWRLVARQGLVPVLLGLSAGLAGAAVAGRLVSGLLFDVRATDPVTFAAVSIVLLLAATLACYFPARRATRVDPMVALRYE